MFKIPEIFRAKLHPQRRPKPEETLRMELTRNLEQSITNEIGLGFRLHGLELVANMATVRYDLIARVSIELPDGVHKPLLWIGESASAAGVDISDVVSYRFDDVRAAIIDAVHKYLWSEDRRPV